MEACRQSGSWTKWGEILPIYVSDSHLIKIKGLTHMANPNNPAGRLYLILREAKRQEADLSVLKVWVSVFNFDPKEVRLVFERLTQMFDLLVEAEKEIKRLEVRTDLYLKHFPLLREILLPTNLVAHVIKVEG